MPFGSIFGLVAAALIFGGLACVFVPLIILFRVVVYVTRRIKSLFVSREHARASSILSDAELASPTTIVFLIHGTFAPDATWTNEDSALCEAIRKQLSHSGQPVIFQRLQWSGANTVTSRLNAIEALSTHLETIISKSPSRHIVLVGHSHGGNIALKVAQRFASHKTLSLVTLATPFLIAQLRKFPDLYRLGVPVVGYAAALLGTIALAAFAKMPWYVAAIPILIGCGFAYRTLSPRLRGAEQAEAQLIASVPDLRCVSALIPNTLIITRTGDEADGIIQLASFLNGWIAKSIRQSSIFTGVAHYYQGIKQEVTDIETRVVEHAPKQTARQFLSALVTEHPKLIWLTIRYVNRMRDNGLEMFPVLSGIFLLKLLQFAVGTGTGIVATTTLVTSSETPPGRWNHYQSIASAEDQAAPLSHSQIYEDSIVLDEIANWITARECVHRSIVVPLATT